MYAEGKTLHVPVIVRLIFSEGI